MRYFVALLVVAGCGTSHRTGDPTVDAGDDRDGDSSCLIECAPPPDGCHYEGSASCSPPSCPRLVCEGPDAGEICLPCVPPPPGCDYTDGCSCGGLVCDDVACGTDTEPRFPTFDRDCGSDAGCFVAMHMTDCCGTMVAMGLAASERGRFSGAEEVCEGMYPGCGCDSGLTTADDGTTSFDGSPPSVACLAGTCTTSYGAAP